MEDSGPDGMSEVRWASRVNPRTIRQLYEADARGIVDAELLNDVGHALLARCQGVLSATEAQSGRVTCPRCQQVVFRDASGPRDKPDEILICRCGWSVRWRDYFASFQGKHLVGGGATAMHRTFVEDFGRAQTPAEKMRAIDRLIHAFHWELVREPGRSAARELIYAKNTTELLTFLDRLAYGEGSTPGLRDGKATWDRKLNASPWHRLTGFRPKQRIQRDGD